MKNPRGVLVSVAALALLVWCSVEWGVAWITPVTPISSPATGPSAFASAATESAPIAGSASVFPNEAAERIEVDITMTTPACPMSSMIAEQAREVILAALPAETEVMVNLVWDPPWDASMMSDHAREHFGWR